MTSPRVAAMGRLPERLSALALAALLAAGGPAWATPVGVLRGLAELLQGTSHIPALARVTELLKESDTLHRSGNVEAAIARLDEAAQALRAEGGAANRELAGRVERMAAERRGWRDLDRAWDAAGEALRQGGDPTDAQAAARGSDLSALPAARRPVVDGVIRALHDVGRAPPRVMWVAPPVRRFATEFRQGFVDAPGVLHAARARHADLVDRWLAAPLDKRIFVIGAGADARRIEAAAQALQPQGYVVFFYDFCAQAQGRLCSSEAVGAFFTTAGHAVLVDTPAAAASRYVAVELAAARHARGLGSRVVVVSPVEVALHAERGGRIWALQLETDD